MAVLSGSANLRYDAEKQALIISNAQNAFLVDQSAPPAEETATWSSPSI